MYIISSIECQLQFVHNATIFIYSVIFTKYFMLCNVQTTCRKTKPMVIPTIFLHGHAT